MKNILFAKLDSLRSSLQGLQIRSRMGNLHLGKMNLGFSVLLLMMVITQVQAFEPPPKSGTPKGTSGGGTRPVSPARCLSSHPTPLQTLTPPTGTGFTDNPRPQYWVYLPPHKAVELEFTLQTIDGLTEESYQVVIPAPQDLGWTALSLPKDVPALQPKRTYRWSVALVCNPIDRPSEDAVVRGNLVYQPHPTEVDLTDTSQNLRDHYWLDAMTKMSNNWQVISTKSNKPSAQHQGLKSRSIADESWKALLLQSLRHPSEFTSQRLQS